MKKRRDLFCKIGILPLLTVAIFAKVNIGTELYASNAQQREYSAIPDEDILTGIPMYGGDDLAYSSDDDLDKDDLKVRDLVLLAKDNSSFNLFVDMSDASNIKAVETEIRCSQYVVNNSSKGKSKKNKRKDKSPVVDNDNDVLEVKYNNGKVTVIAPEVKNIMVYTVDIEVININDRTTKPNKPFTVTVYPNEYDVKNATILEVAMPSSNDTEIKAIADFSPILTEGFTYNFKGAKISASYESTTTNTVTMTNEEARSLVSSVACDDIAAIAYNFKGSNDKPIKPGRYTVVIECQATPTQGGLSAITATLTQNILIQ